MTNDQWNDLVKTRDRGQTGLMMLVPLNALAVLMTVTVLWNKAPQRMLEHIETALIYRTPAVAFAVAFCLLLLKFKNRAWIPAVFGLWLAPNGISWLATHSTTGDPFAALLVSEVVCCLAPAVALFFIQNDVYAQLHAEGRAAGIIQGGVTETAAAPAAPQDRREPPADHLQDARRRRDARLAEVVAASRDPDNPLPPQAVVAQLQEIDEEYEREGAR
jgi:hypothetical protein